MREGGPESSTFWVESLLGSKLLLSVEGAALALHFNQTAQGLDSAEGFAIWVTFKFFMSQ